MTILLTMLDLAARMLDLDLDLNEHARRVGRLNIAGRHFQMCFSS